jgi:CheY-like chemotaxis protein
MHQSVRAIVMKLILLVEDSRLLRIMNQRALRGVGYSVLTASDGEEAVRLARERIPDLIILDMLLPKLGGPQVLRALKYDVLTAHIPVIVLSSLPQSNESRLKKKGAAAYFDKSTLMLHQDSDAIVKIARTILLDGSPLMAGSPNKVESGLTRNTKGSA